MVSKRGVGGFSAGYSPAWSGTADVTILLFVCTQTPTIFNKSQSAAHPQHLTKNTRKDTSTCTTPMASQLTNKTWKNETQQQQQQQQGEPPTLQRNRDTPCPFNKFRLWVPKKALASPSRNKGEAFELSAFLRATAWPTAVVAAMAAMARSRDEQSPDTTQKPHKWNYPEARKAYKSPPAGLNLVVTQREPGKYREGQRIVLKGLKAAAPNKPTQSSIGMNSTRGPALSILRFWYWING